MMRLDVAEFDAPDQTHQLSWARDILQLESRALDEVARRLDFRFCQAVETLTQCRGSVFVSGIGKAGLVGQKISATFASTGTRSQFLHPAEAFHGDLGRLNCHDVILILSQSGETEEVVRLLPSLSQLEIRVVAITGQQTSTLARCAQVTLTLGTITEACQLGLAPSTSTTVMLAVGDALALVMSRMRNFRAEDFARFHPGGSLGLKLSYVEDYMRPLTECRMAQSASSVREAVTRCALPGRRTGAIMLISPEGQLCGMFTDSDLARLVENRRESDLDGPVANVMSAEPWTIPAGSPMSQAIEVMVCHKISELPVVDPHRRPIGLIDGTDIASLLPRETHARPKAA